MSTGAPKSNSKAGSAGDPPERFAPAAIVVDSDLRIIHLHGGAGSYLLPAVPASGLPLLRILLPDLVPPFRTAVRRARKERLAVTVAGIPLHTSGGSVQTVRVEVVPLASSRFNTCDFLIVLQPEPVPATAVIPELTPRQREVLQLFAEGKSLKEVAAVLRISAKTAEYHKYRIMKHLGVRTNAEMTKYAVRVGLSTL